MSVLVHNVNKRARKEESDTSPPESRSFYMSMTPLPYDITFQAIMETYNIVKARTDLITHHFDSGVPWPEAFEGKTYHHRVEGDINFRLSRLQEGQKVYLAVTPIATWRNSLAGYWAEKDNGERPGIWKDKDFDDPMVIAAYTNYCRHMIEEFQPDFMAYGVEVNALALLNPTIYEKFLVMAEEVYETLKTENPELPIFLTLHVDTFHQFEAMQREAIEKLLPYTDYIAVSSYPFNYKADPKELPEDWFSKITELAPEKPFAVAETGFPAEDVIREKVRISGNERWQAEYVQFLLNKSNELNAKFVVWFVPIDYDLLWTKLGKMGHDERLIDLIRNWRDCGLFNERREARLSLKVWGVWLKLPIQGRGIK